MRQGAMRSSRCLPFRAIKRRKSCCVAAASANACLHASPPARLPDPPPPAARLAVALDCRVTRDCLCPWRSSRLPPGSAPGVKLEVSLSMLADSTMAVEVAMSEVLLNWPYFKDLSLVGSTLRPSDGTCILGCRSDPSACLHILPPRLATCAWELRGGRW